MGLRLQKGPQWQPAGILAFLAPTVPVVWDVWELLVPPGVDPQTTGCPLSCTCVRCSCREHGMLGTRLDSFAARILNIKQIWLMRSTCWTSQTWSEVELIPLPSLAVPCWQTRLRKHECVCLWFLQGPARWVPGSSGGSSFQRLSLNPSYGRVLLNRDPGHLVGQFYGVPEPSWRPRLEPTSAALLTTFKIRKSFY